METPNVDPLTFAAMLANAEPGWSEQFGGPKGIALTIAEMQKELVELSQTLAAARVAAIQELLKTQSGIAVAKELGISRAAVSKLHRNQAWENPTW